MSKSYASSPWKIIRRHNSVADSRVIVTDDRVQTHIAYITPGDGLGHETETVLSTIAAASELLAALKAMVKMHAAMMAKTNHGASFYDADCLREMNEAPLQAAAVLKKVEG